MRAGCHLLCVVPQMSAGSEDWVLQTSPRYGEYGIGLPAAHVPRPWHGAACMLSPRPGVHAELDRRMAPEAVVGHAALACGAALHRAKSCPQNVPAADASGSEKPDPAAVQALVQQICSDPQAAGERFKTAVQAGGSQAQVAALALFQVCQGLQGVGLQGVGLQGVGANSSQKVLHAALST